MDNDFPAYPVVAEFDVLSTGMTLRDHFAGLAMQAMIAKSHVQDRTSGKNGVPLVAKFAYEYADTMLKAREVGGD